MVKKKKKKTNTQHQYAIEIKINTSGTCSYMGYGTTQTITIKGDRLADERAILDRALKLILAELRELRE